MLIGIAAIILLVVIFGEDLDIIIRDTINWFKGQ